MSKESKGGKKVKGPVKPRETWMQNWRRNGWDDYYWDGDVTYWSYPGINGKANDNTTYRAEGPAAEAFMQRPGRCHDRSGFDVKIQPFWKTNDEDYLLHEGPKKEHYDEDWYPCLCCMVPPAPPPPPPAPPMPTGGIDVDTHVHLAPQQPPPPKAKKIDCPLHYPYGGTWMYPQQFPQGYPQPYPQGYPYHGSGSRYDHMRRYMQYNPHLQFSPGRHHKTHKRR